MTVNTEKIILNKERNVTLTAMVQTVDGEWKFHARPAIMVIPGGGYIICSDREAETVAYPYLAAGFQAFVLRYSVGDHRTWPNPLKDYEQAMEYIRSHAEELHVIPDKIAVVGFSAGGHLAACAATMAENRPNAALLIYAALDQEITDACQPGKVAPAPMKFVDGKTPPCFLAAARDDSIVPIQNTVDFLTALGKKAITYECHIYPFGNHGFGTGDEAVMGNSCSRIPNWVKDSIAFLQDVFGHLQPSGMTEPVCPGKQNGDFNEFLSADCTIGRLRGFLDQAPVLTPIIAAFDTHTAKLFTDGSENITNLFKLNQMMEMFGKTPEEIQAIDEILNSIPNTGM